MPKWYSQNVMGKLLLTFEIMGLVVYEHQDFTLSGMHFQSRKTIGLCMSMYLNLQIALGYV